MEHLGSTLRSARCHLGDTKLDYLTKEAATAELNENCNAPIGPGDAAGNSGEVLHAAAPLQVPCSLNEQAQLNTEPLP